MQSAILWKTTANIVCFIQDTEGPTKAGQDMGNQSSVRNDIPGVGKVALKNNSIINY